MKKLLFTLLLSSSLFAQEKATDLFNANVSFIGIGIQYEKALNDNFTALGTLDYMGGFSYSNNSYYGGSDFEYILSTRFALEGRYYYNFDRRIGKGKNTKNNSGNYIALKGAFIPDWLTTSNSNYYIEPQGMITFNYGLKRSFAQNFFYEFYTGLGLSLYQDDKVTFDNEIQNYKYYKKTETGVALDLGFRVGYNF